MSVRRCPSCGYSCSVLKTPSLGSTGPRVECPGQKGLQRVCDICIVEGPVVLDDNGMYAFGPSPATTPVPTAPLPAPAPASSWPSPTSDGSLRNPAPGSRGHAGGGSGSAGSVARALFPERSSRQQRERLVGCSGGGSKGRGGKGSGSGSGGGVGTGGGAVGAGVFGGFGVGGGGTGRGRFRAEMSPEGAGAECEGSGVELSSAADAASSVASASAVEEEEAEGEEQVSWPVRRWYPSAKDLVGLTEEGSRGGITDPSRGTRGYRGTGAQGSTNREYMEGYVEIRDFDSWSTVDGD